MYQAIVTKYLPPTNFREGRVKATANAGSITVPWNSAYGSSGNDVQAAKALAQKLGWSGAWIGGVLPDNRVVFVSTRNLPGFVADFVIE